MPSHPCESSLPRLLPLMNSVVVHSVQYQIHPTGFKFQPLPGMVVVARARLEGHPRPRLILPLTRGKYSLILVLRNEWHTDSSGAPPASSSGPRAAPPEVCLAIR